MGGGSTEDKRSPGFIEGIAGSRLKGETRLPKQWGMKVQEDPLHVGTSWTEALPQLLEGKARPNLHGHCVRWVMVMVFSQASVILIQIFQCAPDTFTPAPLNYLLPGPLVRKHAPVALVYSTFLRLLHLVPQTSPQKQHS